MHAFTLIFLAVTLSALALQLWLNHRHLKHVAQHRAEVPKAFADKITLEQHQKAADYTEAKAKLNRVDLILETVLLLAFTLGGGVQALYEFSAAYVSQPVLQGVLLIVSFSVLSSLIGLPLSWYRTFHLEQRFGFNTQTAKLFWIDLLKKTALGLVLEAPMIALVLWLFGAMGAYWWLWAWGALMALQLVLFALYPTWIAPLFNKFTPLNDESLQARINQLLDRAGFKASGVFVMDGSTRSRHGNAYFTGFGRNKRIVFFDTLLENLSPAEIEAVLAHELGHFHHGHVKKRLVMMAVLSLGGLWLLGVLATAPWFFSGLGVSAQTPALALLLFMLTLPVFLTPISPLFNLLSRKDEFEADRFAAKQSNAMDLVNALVKLYQDNAATLTPDPLYSGFYDSHPPAPIRIAALESQL